MTDIKYLFLLVCTAIFSVSIKWHRPVPTDGLVVGHANGIGVNVVSAGTNAIQITQAGIDGVQVQSAGRDGIRVSNAAEYGINATGTMGAGFFDGQVTVNGAMISTTMGVNTSVPANAQLSVKGNTTFGGNMKLTSLSATPSPGNNILEVEFDSFTDPVADAWTTYSSRRWKKNIRTFDNALEKISRLRGVKYEWEKNGKSDFGLVAEEVAEVFPEVVEFEENGVDAKSVDYARLVAVLIEAVKEQQTMIEKLSK